MSIVTALFALGPLAVIIALTIPAGITTYYLMMRKYSDPEDRQRAGRLLVILASILCVGAFLIGLITQGATA